MALKFSDFLLLAKHACGRQNAVRGSLWIEALERRTMLSSALPQTDSSAKPQEYYTPILSVSPAADSTTPTGITPSRMRSAYGIDQIPASGGIAHQGQGQTIAIVDAYNDPYALADLNAFSQHFNLPLMNLPGGPTFRVVNQTGGSTLPTNAAGGNWASEISLDIQWAHVIAPQANILLVEADSNWSTDLNEAVDTARHMPGVSVVSMSFGGSEESEELNDDSFYTTPSGHQGVTFVASTGDSGEPGGYPAFSPNVVAVGGTALTISDWGSYVSEQGWSGSGGGISSFEPQPAYQKGIVTQSTTMRTTPDVAMDGAEDFGVPVYDSYDYGNSSVWQEFYGTSLAAPMFAGLIAIANEVRVASGLTTLDGPTQTLPKLYAAKATMYHDVTSGNNGFAAGPGYDLVTGRGSPVPKLLVSTLASPDAAQVWNLTVQPNAQNSSQAVVPTASDTIVSIADGGLLTAIRSALHIYSGPITTGNLAGLTSLSADFSYIENLAGLQYATNLTNLELIGNIISDLSPLTHLTNLQQIYLASNQISNLQPLAGLTQLQTLSIGGNLISNLSPLAKLTNLNNLDLSSNQISNLTPLAKLTKLQVVNLSQNKISSISPLASLPGLNFLLIETNQIADLGPLSGLSQLRTLVVAENKIRNISPLAGITHLQVLSLASNQIANITPLTRLEDLTHLYLVANQIGDIQSLSGLTQLRSLYLSANQISDITPLAGLSRVHNLGLSYNQIVDITPLAGLGRLEYLNLSYNHISDISSLSGKQKILTLLLEYNQLQLSDGTSDLISTLRLGRTSVTYASQSQRQVVYLEDSRRIVYRQTDGTQVNITLAGLTARITAYGIDLSWGHNYTGPSSYYDYIDGGIQSIDVTIDNVANPNPGKGSLTFTTIKPANIVAGFGDGTAYVGSITGQNLGSLNAGNVNLVGTGLSFTGAIGTTTLRDLTNGASVHFGPSSKTLKMTYQRIGADSTIDVGSDAIGSFIANEVDQGASITASKIATLTTTALAARTLTGDFDATLTLSGVGLLTKPNITLGSMTIAGALDHAIILSAGNVGSVTAASMISSTFYAGVNTTNHALPATASQFTFNSTIASLTIKGVAGSSTANNFVDSNVAAATLTMVSIKNAQLDNNGTKFGVFGQTIKSLTLTQGTKKYTWSRTANTKWLLTPVDLTVQVLA